MKNLFAMCLLLALAACSPQGTSDDGFDRVLDSGTLRCGYYVFPPVTYRDQKTNALSGFSIDMMNTIGKRAGLKIEWVEEVNFGNWVPALQAKRFDALCTPAWSEILLGKAVAFSNPIMYAGLSPMVRADDARFKNATLERMNRPDVTFVTQDGNAIDALTHEAFPQTKVYAVSATMDGPTVLQEVVTKKADAILLDRNGEVEYNKNNAVKLRLVDRDRPVKAQAFTFAVARDNLQLQNFLNNAVAELHADGTINRLLDKWEEQPDTFLRVDKPHILSTSALN